jgi:hypothetical protein
VTVRRESGAHGHPPPSIGTLSAYWEIRSDFEGAFTCDLEFGYRESDLNGAAEQDISGAARWSNADARWTYLVGTVDIAANTVTIPDVSAFSTWVLIASAPPEAIADLTGARVGNDLRLSWPAVTQDIRGRPVTVDHYVVYRRADEPYFAPNPSDVLAKHPWRSHTDRGVQGDAEHGYYYVVTAVDSLGLESATSNRLGAFDFGLAPAGLPDDGTYNPIALNLAVPGVDDADSLARYVGDGVASVLRYDAATQSIQERQPGQVGPNFAAGLGDALFVTLADSAPSVVSLVGRVPSRDEVRYALARPARGASCTYNFVSVPLGRADLTDADTLARDIGGVYTVSRYNAETQDLTWRVPGMAGENFAVRPGHPYLICASPTAPSHWP